MTPNQKDARHAQWGATFFKYIKTNLKIINVSGTRLSQNLSIVNSRLPELKFTI